MLSQKVQAVEEVFALLAREMLQFQGWSGLTCKSGCGNCCKKADIEATVLEFIPFAHYLYLAGQSFEWLDRIAQNHSKLCVIYEPSGGLSGRCGQYAHRGLICRLFGFSARVNKYAKNEFITCQTIKSEQGIAYAETLSRVVQGEFVPIMSHYYMRMLAIDSDLARDFYPINEAIKKAIETVLHYYAYRDDAV